MPPPDFNELIARRNAAERTNGYNEWHALPIMVQAHDLEFQAGVPDASTAYDALTWALADARLYPGNPENLRHAAACIALQIEYLEREQHTP